MNLISCKCNTGGNVRNFTPFSASWAQREKHTFSVFFFAFLKPYPTMLRGSYGMLGTEPGTCCVLGQSSTHNTVAQAPKSFTRTQRQRSGSGLGVGAWDNVTPPHPKKEQRIRVCVGKRGKQLCRGHASQQLAWAEGLSN